MAADSATVTKSSAFDVGDGDNRVVVNGAIKCDLVVQAGAGDDSVSLATRSQPFASAGAMFKLEANLGFFQAIETADAETMPVAIPTTVQPAAVATALPARASE